MSFTARRSAQSSNARPYILQPQVREARELPLHTQVDRQTLLRYYRGESLQKLDYALRGHSGPVFYLDRVVEFLIIATSHRFHSHEEALLDSSPSLIGRIVTLKEQHTEKSFVVEPKAVVPPKD